MSSAPPAPGDADADLGFSWRPVRQGAVAIARAGRVVTVLRGAAARDFVGAAQRASPAAAQQLMARVTGNYRRGNERGAAQHPRNRARDAA